MKYQIRIKNIMSDEPASELLDTYKEAAERLREVRKEIGETWAMPDTNAAYIYENWMA